MRLCVHMSDDVVRQPPANVCPCPFLPDQQGQLTTDAIQPGGHTEHQRRQVAAVNGTGGAVRRKVMSHTRLAESHNPAHAGQLGS